MDNAAPAARSIGMEHRGGMYFKKALEDGGDEFALREEEPLGRGVTLHL